MDWSERGRSFALLAALRHSPTFLPSLLWLLLPAMLVVAALAMPVAARLRHRQFRLSHLHASSSGVVLAADLVLVLVPLITIMLVLLQTLWLMRETVIVHYAAFNAARSARVHLCPPRPESALTFIAQSRKDGCTGDVGRADYAARMSLISASPPWGIPCQAQCEVPAEVLQAIASNTGVGDQSDAILDQARYAFDPDNVDLTISYDRVTEAMALLKGGTMPVIRARLVFRNYVTYGLGPVFGTRRDDGYYYRETEAEVDLL